MDTIKIYDLSNLAKEGSLRLKADMRITLSKGKDGHLGSRLLTFNYGNEAIMKGFDFINFAENSLTSDIYIIFSKSRGVQLRKRAGRNQGSVCTKNSVIDLLLKLLKQDIKPTRADIIFSDNLSKSDDQITYKINEIKIL